MQAQVRIADGLILAFGDFPAGSPDPESIEIVDLAPGELEKFEEAGNKTLNDRGVITVTPSSVVNHPPATIPPPDLLAQVADQMERATTPKQQAAAVRALADALRKVGT